MYFQWLNSALQGQVASYAVASKKQTYAVPNVDFSPATDQFVRTTPPQSTSPPPPRFGFWGTAIRYGLPFVSYGLTQGRQHINESMREDEYQRNRQRTFYSESTRTQYDGSYYRYVTTHKAYDGNRKRLRRLDYTSKSDWYRVAPRPARRRRR
jgi:hypothetical protein